MFTRTYRMSFPKVRQTWGRTVYASVVLSALDTAVLSQEALLDLDLDSLNFIAALVEEGIESCLVTQ